MRADRRRTAFALTAVAAAASLSILTACGEGTQTAPAADADVITDQGLTPSQARPPAALAPGTLARIADNRPAQTRIAYVSRRRLRSFDAPLPAGEIARLVLGAGAARLGGAAADVATATQIAGATVLDGPSGRTVVGGSGALRRVLADARPQTSIITSETTSAVQSCLGDPATQTVVGPAVLGPKAAAGAGLQDDAGQPAGPKLLLCFAPHYVRHLATVERRLTGAFGGDDQPAGAAPVIGEADIGERDIVRAIVSLDAVPKPMLRELLAGGPALVALAGAR